MATQPPKPQTKSDIAGSEARPEAAPPPVSPSGQVAVVEPVNAQPGIASEALLGSQGELKIRHNGDLYSLRKTRLNKLILTK